MSTLELTNFRCHRKGVMPLSPGLTLIRGPGTKPSSGIGKSSYLMAFEWLLYGGREAVGTDDAPHGSQVSVEWKWVGGGISIFRQKSPSRILRVRSSTLDLVDDVAQVYIESLFGSYSFWVSSSYIGQDERCPLLTASGPDRLSILNEIAFRDEDPQKIIKAIEERSSGLQREISNEQAQIAMANESWNRDVTRLGINTSHFIESIETINSRVNELKALIPRLEAEWLENEKNQYYLNQLMVRKNDRIGRLVDLPDSVESIEERMRLVRDQKVVSEYHSLKDSLPPLTNSDIKMSDIVSVEDLEARIANQERILKKWNLKTTDEAKKRLEVIRKQIELVGLVEAHKRKESIESLLQASLKSLTRRVGMSEVRDLEHSLRVLNCPKCHTNLELSNGCLREVTMSRADPAELDELRRLASLTMTVEDLERKLESYNGLGPKPESILTVGRDEQYDLSTLRDLEVPKESSLELRKSLEIKLRYKSLLDLKARYPGIDEMTPSLTSPRDITELTNLLNRVKEQIAIKKEIEEIDRSIESIKKITGVRKEDVLAAKTELESLYQRLKAHETYMVYIGISNEIKVRIEHLNAKVKELEHWNELKHRAVELEYKLLNNVVGRINTEINETLQSMFDGQLQANLSTTRELSDGRQKAQVNIQILKDGVSKTFKQLSGGQKDRLSLALTLALSKIQRFPLILLDESTDSLGDDLKEICLKEIRKVLGKKGALVIDIGHGENEGNYDRSFIVGV